MSIMTFLIIVAMLCVLGSLGMGIVAMTRDGQIGHRTSAQWMTLRVAFQGLALGLVLLALWT